MRDIRRLSEIRDAFDAVLIDQFGVLHDGRAAFPGTQDCMAFLADNGVPVVALSNSGKRAHLNVRRLIRLGFSPGWFRGVITSGELAFREISMRLDSGLLPANARISVLSRDDDASMISGLPTIQVGLGDVPDLLIIAGAEPEVRTLNEYIAELVPLANAGVPALCINPDLKIYASGKRAFGPGLIARCYCDLGGSVEMLGKPGEAMFAAGFRALDEPPPKRTLMIGDSPEHDIAGARSVGCISLLISSGVQSCDGGDADFRMVRLKY